MILATVTDFVSTITSACHKVDAVGTQEETLEELREGFIKQSGKYSIPGEKLTYLHVQTIILAQKLLILEFLEGAAEKSRLPWGPPGRVRPNKTFENHFSCIFRKSQ